MKRHSGILMLGSLAGLSLGGCTSQKLGPSLGTMKNPAPIYGQPRGIDPQDKVNLLILANYNVLREAVAGAQGNVTIVDLPAAETDTAKKTGEEPGDTATKIVPTPKMDRYLTAGFALSDIYCDQFFRDAEESQRRRKFGRAVTNDTGTAITTILGLANAGQNIVTGVAAGFGLGDNLWRNYDEAFVVSPDLANVRSLVLAAQDNFRERTLGEKQVRPKTYSTAQSVILRYANQCSTLGMRLLLDQSATQQRTKLTEDTESLKPAKEDKKTNGENGSETKGTDSQGSKGGGTAPTTSNAPAPAPATTLPAAPITITPSLTPG
ncbi:MAG TPA: hypothetical protein VFQ52_01060 [Rhizomicrobium sp.]|nr:hypothetical protein [Rhizomicrobium sp.]